VARIHYILDESTVSRSIVAWPAPREDDELLTHDSVAVLAERGGGYALSLRTVDQLYEGLAAVLLADDSLRMEGWACGMTALGVIALLAAGSVYSRAALEAQLTHQEPSAGFHTPDLRAALAAATTPDPRWPLHLANEVLPGGLLQSIDAQSAEEGLAELEELQLLMRAAAGNGGTQEAQWQLTEGGLLIARGLVAPSAATAIRLTALRGDAQPGHELLLFVRDDTRLWLFDVSGGDGAVASTDAAGFREVFLDLANRRSRALEANPPAAVGPQSEEPLPGSQAGAPGGVARTLCECGQPLSGRFCTRCGQPATSPGCPDCGTGRRAGAVFCHVCGHRW